MKRRAGPEPRVRVAHRCARVGNTAGVKVRMLFQPFKNDLSLYRVLELALADGRFSSLTVVVAWAKESGLQRIRPLLSAFRERGALPASSSGSMKGARPSRAFVVRLATLMRQQSCTTHPGPFTPSCTSSTARQPQ